MAGTILTPSAIWKNFSVETDFDCQVVSESTHGDVIFTNVVFNGRTVSDGRVKISGVIAKNIQSGVMPSVLVAQDFNSNDQDLILELAKQGYTVLSVDLGGADDGKEFFTSYPESISYANYNLVKDNLYEVEGDASKTCWYEWGCVLRYALAFLKSKPEITAVGGFGIGEAAAALWEVAGTDENLDCTVFALNAGWAGYRGIYKFGGMVEPQFSDNMYKFIAGIEPQAYAMHVKRPILMLSATNSKLYDCDRAFDTLTRINKDVYTAINYSVGYRERVSGESFRSALVFFERFLLKGDVKNTFLPSDVDIKCDTVDGRIKITVSVDGKDIEEIAVYSSEQTADPSLRCWHKNSRPEQETEEGYVFDYLPYHDSKMVVFFAQVKYKSGLTVGSKLISKKFESEEVIKSHKSNIIYSSRILESESVFSAAEQDAKNSARVNVLDKKRVFTKKGPMGIVGAYSEWGLLTFKINADKDHPQEGAMLMLDAYCKNGGTLTVKLISDYFGAKVEYAAKAQIAGGDVWHNFKFEMARFKTAEGKSLKNYDVVSAIEILVDGEDYLVNNALWV